MMMMMMMMMMSPPKQLSRGKQMEHIVLPSVQYFSAADDSESPSNTPLHLVSLKTRGLKAPTVATLDVDASILALSQGSAPAPTKPHLVDISLQIPCKNRCQ